MWSKANPIGMRVGLMKSRPAEWFAKDKRAGADFFVEDIKMRKFVDDTFGRSGISKVVIRKTAKEWEIIIFSSRRLYKAKKSSDIVVKRCCPSIIRNSVFLPDGSYTETILPKKCVLLLFFYQIITKKRK